MNDFLKSIRVKILVAILAVMAGFMVMSIYTGGTASLFAQLISIITVPAQRFSASITGEITVFFDRIANASRTYDENERLRAELNEMRGRLVDYDKIKHENEQFREIIGVKESRQDITLEIASVIARDPSDRFHMFTIDKGTLDGISYLDPVITADGLVGYVTEVGLASSKIKTILDVTIDVGAYSSATRDIGIVTGTIELASKGLCHIEYLPLDSKIEPGNIVLTSGGALFPKDIVIGTVSEVTPGRNGISLLAVIEPAARITTVKDVFVVTSFEGQGGEAAGE